MFIRNWTKHQRKVTSINAKKFNYPTIDGSHGLWTRCDGCGIILYIKHLIENYRVCVGCGYNLHMNTKERIEQFLDYGSWRPIDEDFSPCDPIEFQDERDYFERLEEAQERTGFQDAIQTGTGMLHEIPVAFAVMDFTFMGGSMGSVVGEKLTRLIEYATKKGLTLLVVCASGGARMQEGIYSLMQMAKISAALHKYQSSGTRIYISILTSPTTGGVTASFAMSADLVLAEPRALIGFAGRRVIEETLQEVTLPVDFQTAEYLLFHGLINHIIPRNAFKGALFEILSLYKNAPYKRSPLKANKTRTSQIENKTFPFGDFSKVDKAENHLRNGSREAVRAAIRKAIDNAIRKRFSVKGLRENQRKDTGITKKKWSV